MAYNKIIYKGEVLVDLTQDSVTAETLAVGATAHDKSGEVIVGTFEGNNGIDTSDATATAGDIIKGKTAYVDGEKLTGIIPTRSFDDMTFRTTRDFGYVEIADGYYPGGMTRTFPDGLAVTPTRTITTTPTISVDSTGKITASVNSANSIAPTVTAGYVGKGIAGTITFSGSATMQLTTQAAKTITPSTTSQTAVASGRYTTGAVTVAAIPSNYEDVTTETNAYTTKLASLETAITALETELEGKASGGGSGGGNIETCTVNIVSRGLGGIHYYGVTQYIDGAITNTIVMINENSSTNLTFENVVCSSFLCFHTSDGILPTYSVTNGSIVTTGVNRLRIWMVSLTSSPNVTETITVWDDD